MKYQISSGFNVSKVHMGCSFTSSKTEKLSKESIKELLKQELIITFFFKENIRNVCTSKRISNKTKRHEQKNTEELKIHGLVDI